MMPMIETNANEMNEMNENENANENEMTWKMQLETQRSLQQ